MAYTFRLAQGCQTGKSLVEPDKTDVAKAALAKAKQRGVKFLLPVDDVVAVPVKTDKLDKKGKPVIEYQNVRVNTDQNCPADAAGLDIGPATVKAFSQEVASAKTILWNGPMGLFEDKRFAEGTNRRRPRGGRSHPEERRQEHHRRRRQREGAEQSQAGRQSDLYEHRRRRQPRIPRRQGPARRGGLERQRLNAKTQRSKGAKMNENEISYVIVGAAIEVHRELGGPGLLEGVYEEAMVEELTLRGLKAERQLRVPIVYKGKTLGVPLRLDLKVNGLVLVDNKAVTEWNPIFEAQMLTYLRLTKLKLGLVINFGEQYVKNGIHRVVNGL